MVLTILFNTVCGLLTMIPLVFVLPEISELILLAQPVPTIVKSAVGNAAGSFVLLVPILVLGIICGTGCTTATSRSIYAFSRDGAIPGSKWWKVVHPKLDVPLNGMMLSMVIQIALGLIYFGSSAAFNAFSGVGVIALTAAYAVPIVVSMLERRKTVATASFSLGKYGWFCNAISIGEPSFTLLGTARVFMSCANTKLAWSALVIPLFSMPTTVPVTDSGLVNYAPVVFVGFTLISLAWYIAWGRKNYSGPPVAA
jgi:amino acid transporter